MNKKLSKALLTSASTLALLAAYPQVADQVKNVGFDFSVATVQAADATVASFVNESIEIPSVSAIKDMGAEELTDTVRQIKSARATYESLSSSDRKHSSAIKWVGFLETKENSLVKNAILLAIDLPRVDRVLDATGTVLEGAEKDIESVRELFDVLPEEAQAHPSVIKWEGFLTEKEDAVQVRKFVEFSRDIPTVAEISEKDAEELAKVKAEIATAEEMFKDLRASAKQHPSAIKWAEHLEKKADAVKEAKEDVEDVEDVELVVESVSAINNQTFEFTVTLNEAVTEAKPATLTLGDLSVVARATSTNGNLVTYTISSADHAKLVTGNYNVSIEGVATTAHTANYEKLVTETAITGIAVNAVSSVAGDTTTYSDDLEKDGISGVTVKVDNQTTTTNGLGYFNITNVLPGLKEVTFSKAGFFTKRQSIDTKRTFESSQIVELQERQKSMYAIEGTILDSETSTPVKDDTLVTLQQLVNGAWVTLTDADGEAYTAKTNAGKFAFVNSSSATVTVTDADAKVEVGNKLDFAENGSIKYRVVANNKLSNSNFTNVYVDQTSAEFTLSDEKPTTTPAVIKVTKVKEVKNLNFNAVWAETAKETATGIKFTLVDTDGETKLVTEAELTTVKKNDERHLTDKEAINLVSKGIFKEGGTAVNPRLPKGTYFLFADDGVTENAKAILAIQITEEGQVVNLSAEFTESANLTPTVAVKSTKYNAVYNLTGGDIAVTGQALKSANATTFNEVETIQAEIKTYLNIGGSRVLVNTPSTTGFNYDATKKEVSTTTAKIDRLPAGSYTVTTAKGNYVTNSESANVSLNKGGSTNETVNVTALGKTTVTITDDADQELAANTIAMVELLDNATGNVVAKNEAKRNATTGAISADASKVFEKVAPGEYKVRVTAVGYETKTSDKFTIMDYQTLTTPTVKLKAGEANVAPKVQGIALFAEDNTAVAGASIVAYDKDGKYVGKQPVAADGSYSFGSTLKAGQTYTLVLRKDGAAETSKQSVTVPTANGAIKAVDFNVVKGGQAKYEVIIVDSKNAPITLGTDVLTKDAGVEVFIKDEFAKPEVDYTSILTNTSLTATQKEEQIKITDGTWINANVFGTTDAENDGFFKLTSEGTTANLFTTTTKLSAGAYTVVITEGTKTKSYAATVTVQKNGNVDGGKIVLQLQDETSNNLTYDVEGVVSLSNASTFEDGYVLALDATGKPVKAAAINPTTGAYKLEALPNNAAYKLVTVLDGKFVSSKTVTVQDRNLTGQNLTATPATR